MLTACQLSSYSAIWIIRRWSPLNRCRRLFVPSPRYQGQVRHSARTGTPVRRPRYLVIERFAFTDRVFDTTKVCKTSAGVPRIPDYRDHPDRLLPVDSQMVVRYKY